MARYAMIHSESGIVVNVIEWDGGSGLTVPDGYEMVEDDPPAAGPGFTYDGSTFTPPPSMIPMEEPDAA